MEIQEIFERVLIESGQFVILNNPKNIILSQPDLFVVLIRATLGTYNKYFPITDNMNINLVASEKHTFNENSGSYGIPDWISSVVPLDGSSGSNPLAQYNILNTLPSSSPYLDNKKCFSFRYKKPDLYVQHSGEFDVVAVYNHKVSENDGPDSSIIYSVDTISHESGTFFKLLQAKFLKSLAWNRRAFTLQPLEITSDAEVLAQEAKEMELEAVQNLHENHNKFYLAFR